MNPSRTIMPHVFRELAEIDPGLRLLLRDLLNGKAPWPLLLHGPVGVGKTCAALCVLDYAGGMYVTVAELTDRTRWAQQGRLFTTGETGCQYEQSEGGYWCKVKRAAVAVLDEIGTRQQVSAHHSCCVQRFTDERSGMPSILLSNLQPDHLAEVYDDRIVSRLCAGSVVKLSARDRRLDRYPESGSGSNVESVLVAG